MTHTIENRQISSFLDWQPRSILKQKGLQRPSSGHRVTFHPLAVIKDSMKSGEVECVERLYGSFSEAQRESIDRCFRAKILQFAVQKESFRLIGNFHLVFDLCKDHHLSRIVFPACRKGKSEIIAQLLLTQDDRCKCNIAWRSIEEMLLECSWRKLSIESQEYQIVGFLFRYAKLDIFSIPSQRKLMRMADRCIKYPCLTDFLSDLLPLIPDMFSSFIADIVCYENVGALRKILACAKVGEKEMYGFEAIIEAVKRDNYPILDCLFEAGFMSDIATLERYILYAIEKLSHKSLARLLDFHHQSVGSRPKILEQAILTAEARELKIIKEFCAKQHYPISLQRLEEALKIAEEHKNGESIEVLKDWINKKIFE